MFRSKEKPMKAWATLARVMPSPLMRSSCSMIHIHNTLTGRWKQFQSVEPNSVRMYVCGITPYYVCHVGHARCYVVFDVVRRVLKANGYQVHHVKEDVAGGMPHVTDIVG